MNIVGLEPEHGDALIDFFRQLSKRDVTLIKEDVTNLAAIARLPILPAQQWVTLDGEGITGYVAVRQLPGWSDHVGELRLVVHPASMDTVGLTDELGLASELGSEGSL